MNLPSQFVLSSACLFGAIILSNSINDVDAGVGATLAIVITYQIALALIGAIVYFIYASLFKKTEVVENEPKEIESKIAVEFNIKDIIFDDGAVIGVFHDADIYDKVKVVFDNGYSAIYYFDDTMSSVDLKNLDVSSLTPGSLILEPGIVYIPHQ